MHHMWGTRPQLVNSSPPSAAYTRRWTGSSLVQVMACRLFGAKPLPEPMLVYCQLDSWKQVSVKFESEFLSFSFTKMHLKMWSAQMAAILSRGKWVKVMNDFQPVMHHARSSKPMLTHCQLGLCEQTSGNSNHNINIFFRRNVFEIVVCEFPAILLRSKYVNPFQ